MSEAHPSFLRRAVVLALATLAAPALQACPRSADVKAADLYGLWRAEFQGLQGATLLLEQHPEDAGSLSGAINRNGARGPVSAEVENGEFNLEESADGTHIFATWAGSVVDGSCGREIRGSWQRDGDSATHPFVLRKLGS